MQDPTPVRPYITPSPLLIIPLLLILFGAILFGGFYWLSASSIIVLIDGHPSVVRTHQTTVGALLTEAGVYLEPEDHVTPLSDTPIRAGMTITLDKAHPVLIRIDDQPPRRILTHQTDPRAILADSAIPLADGDTLQADRPDDIVVRRALSFTVNDNQQKRVVRSAAQTVGAALADVNIPLYMADTVTPDISAPLTEGLTITIQRAIPITIQVDARTLATRTHSATVSAALAEAGIALVGLDSSVPGGDQALTAGTTIRVHRVTDAEEIERTDLPFKHVLRLDPALELDTRRVVQPGVTGVQEIHVRVRREDGVVVSRSAPLTWITQPPTDEIDALGTRVVLHTLDTPDGKISYWRVITMNVASYKPSSTGKAATDPTYGITASGQPLRKGLVAVDPALIPLGTALYIPKYGAATAADTGGGVTGATIDLGYGDDDYAEWSGTVDVYFLAPAPPADQIKPLPEAAP